MQRRGRKLIPSAFLLMVLLSQSPLAFSDAEFVDNKLIIAIEGLTPNKGQVFVSLFKDKKSFLKAPLKSLQSKVTESDHLTLEFLSLNPGEYAVSAYYDENANGELDTNFFGIPSEAVGFSNSPSSSFGPPGFEESRFEFYGSGRMTIRLKKIGD